MRVEIVRHLKEFLELQEVWDELYQQTPGVSPCSSYCWIQGWIEYYLGNSELFIITVYEDEKLVGVFPFYKSHKASFTVLQFLGLKEVSGEIYSVLALPGKEFAVIDIVFSLLEKVKEEWDAIVLYGVRGNSFLQQGIFNSCPRLMKTTRIVSQMLGVAPIQCINEDWDQFLFSCSKSFRKSFRKKSAANQNSGVHFLKETDGGFCGNLIDRLISVEKLSWQGKKGTGVISTSQKFMAHVLPSLIKSGDADVFWALKEDIPIAFKLILKRPECVFAYVAVYNLEYSELSPGFVLNGVMLQELIKCGYLRIDMMTDIGSLSSHKMRWTNHYELTWKNVLYKTNYRGRLIAISQL